MGERGRRVGRKDDEIPFNSQAPERIFSWQKVTTTSLSLAIARSGWWEKVYNCRGGKGFFFWRKKAKNLSQGQGKVESLSLWGSGVVGRLDDPWKSPGRSGRMRRKIIDMIMYLPHPSSHIHDASTKFILKKKKKKKKKPRFIIYYRNKSPIQTVLFLCCFPSHSYVMYSRCLRASLHTDTLTHSLTYSLTHTHNTHEC